MSNVKNNIHIATFYQNLLQKHPLLYKQQFTIEFIAPAGETGRAWDGTAFGRSGHEDPECFTYWGTSATLPEIKISTATVSFMANDFVVPGIIDYGDGKWDVNLLLDQELTQYKKLQNWMDLISDTSKSGGGRKIVPNVQAKLNLLDNTMQKVNKTYVFEGIWITSLGKVEFAPQAGGQDVAKCTASFTYQYFYEASDLENPTISDPLSPSVIDNIASLAKLYTI